ncbi:rho guanine nucleotide exchange factor 33 isoform X1, partial [Clarias magur]
EDTGTALSQISELNMRQKELQIDMDLLQRTQHRSSVKQLYKVGYESSSYYSSTSALTDPAHIQSRKKAAVRRYPDWEAEPSRSHPDISFTSDLESRPKATSSQLHRIPETEGVGSALADAMGAFLPYGDMDACCSSRSHSTDSSIDIAFVSCSPSLSPSHQSHSKGRSSGGGVYRPSHGCVSPDSASVLKPLPLGQRKSKSLNGLQLDSIDSRTHLDPGPPIWEEFKWKDVPGECDHTPLSERSRKEGKGFRSSFKKLFKK